MTIRFDIVAGLRFVCVHWVNGGKRITHLHSAIERSAKELIFSFAKLALSGRKLADRGGKVLAARVHR